MKVQAKAPSDRGLEAFIRIVNKVTGEEEDLTKIERNRYQTGLKRLIEFFDFFDSEKEILFDERAPLWCSALEHLADAIEDFAKELAEDRENGR